MGLDPEVEGEKFNFMYGDREQAGSQLLEPRGITLYSKHHMLWALEIMQVDFSLNLPTYDNQFVGLIASLILILEGTGWRLMAVQI